MGNNQICLTIGQIGAFTSFIEVMDEIEIFEISSK